MRILTLGRLAEAYDRLISCVEAGQRALDTACGTGALTPRAAARGALVKGIDVNSQMLEVARQKAGDTGLVDQILESAEGGIIAPDTMRRFKLNFMGKRVER